MMAQTEEMLTSHMHILAQELETLGFKLNRKKMCVETNADNRISGFPNQFSDHDHSPTRRQGSESDERMQTHDQQEVSNSERIGPPNRLAIINDSSRQRGPTPLPCSPAIAPQNTCTLHLRGRVRPVDTHQPRSQSRPLMVGTTPARIQRPSSCPSFSKLGADNRRLEVWLGRNGPVKKHRRSVDQGGENSPHKPLGDESSPTGFANLCLNKAGHSYSAVDRQLIHNRIHKPQRWNSLQSIVRFGCRDMEMVLSPENNDPCRAHSNTVADAESRQNIEPSDWRLDKGVFNKLHEVWGPFDIDLFAARHNR